MQIFFWDYLRANMSKCFHGSSLDHQNPKSQLTIRLIGGLLGRLFLSPGGLALTSLVDGDKAVMSAIGRAPHFDTRCIYAIFYLGLHEASELPDF
ncbi:hypothetical protein ES703_66684 [subsurface metagenome]